VAVVDNAGTPEGGILAQILLEQGKMSTQLAVISERISDLPDHETRIRTLERDRPGHGTWLRDVALMLPIYGLVIDLIVRGSLR